MSSFGSRVRALRRQARLTQEQLAHETNLSTRSIRNIECGLVNRPHRESVRLLAGVLGLTGDDLVEFERMSHGDFWSGP